MRAFHDRQQQSANFPRSSVTVSECSAPIPVLGGYSQQHLTQTRPCSQRQDVMSESVSRNTTLALDGCKVVYWKMCMAAQAAGDTKPPRQLSKLSRCSCSRHAPVTLCNTNFGFNGNLFRILFLCLCLCLSLSLDVPLATIGYNNCLKLYMSRATTRL